MPECEDVAIILPCAAQKLPEHVDLPSLLTPCPPEKQDTGKRHTDGIDFVTVNFG